MDLILIIVIVIIAFICSYIDCTFGMGYGTLMCPILLIFGYAVSTVVPVLLLSQLFIGGTASIFHHAFKNANFHPKEKDLRKVLLFTAFGAIAVVFAVFIVITVPNFYLMLYIAIMILIVGAMLLFRISFVISKKNLYWISSISAFNKAISGGGFGPIVTSGQMMTGSEVKNAVAITTLSETFLSAFGFTLYIIFGGILDLWLAFFIIIGGIIATPFGAIQTKKIKEEKARLIIGIVVLSLGFMILIKCFI